MLVGHIKVGVLMCDFLLVCVYSSQKQAFAVYIWSFGTRKRSVAYDTNTSGSVAGTVLRRHMEVGCGTLLDDTRYVRCKLGLIKRELKLKNKQS